MKKQKQILKEICEEFALTQITLAKKVGVSESTVNQWSMERSKIPKYLFKIVELMRKIEKLEKNQLNLV